MNTDIVDIEGGRGSNPVVVILVICLVLAIIASIIFIILMATCVYDPANWMKCCPKGAKWDEDAEACKCANGKELDSDMKECVDTSCPPGMRWDSEAKKCVATGTSPVNTTCPAGLKWDNTTQRCISNTSSGGTGPVSTTCSTGLKWDSATQRCVSDGSSGSTGGGTPPGVGCIRGTIVPVWHRQIDSCDVEKEASDACMFQDQSKYGANPGRWAYDALWNARIARNYDCGPTQTDYRGTTWGNICTKALTELPIGLTYEKVGCNKK